MTLVLKIFRLPHGADLPLPAYQTAGSAGLDLASAINITLKPGGRALVPTGFIFQIPARHEGQVRPRSGLALQYGVSVVNSPGTIDADYRGEVSVLLINHGEKDFQIDKGMRIAQLIIAPVVQAEVIEADVVEETARGSGGYGSTGIGAKS